MLTPGHIDREEAHPTLFKPTVEERQGLRPFYSQAISDGDFWEALSGLFLQPPQRVAYSGHNFDRTARR